MKVLVPLKTLFILNEILSQNHHLARQITSLAPKGELPLADLCSCLDKVTSQLIRLESEYFRISLQASSQRVKAAIEADKFYRIQEFKGQTMHWMPYTTVGIAVFVKDIGRELTKEEAKHVTQASHGLRFDNRTALDQLMFNEGWVFVPEYLL